MSLYLAAGPYLWPLEKDRLFYTIGKEFGYFHLTDWLNCVLQCFQQHFSHSNSSHDLCLSWISTILWWDHEVSCPRTLPWKTQRIKCGLNPGSLDYESNTLPLSHAAPLGYFKVMFVWWMANSKQGRNDITWEIYQAFVHGQEGRFGGFTTFYQRVNLALETLQQWRYDFSDVLKQDKNGG